MTIFEDKLVCNNAQIVKITTAVIIPTPEKKAVSSGLCAVIRGCKPTFSFVNALLNANVAAHIIKDGHGTFLSASSILMIGFPSTLITQSAIVPKIGGAASVKFFIKP